MRRKVSGNLAPGLIPALGMSPWEKSDEVCVFAELALSICLGVHVATVLTLSR